MYILSYANLCKPFNTLLDGTDLAVFINESVKRLSYELYYGISIIHHANFLFQIFVQSYEPKSGTESLVSRLLPCKRTRSTSTLKNLTNSSVELS